MTQSRCWECNNMFPSFGYQTLCSACYQTRKIMNSMNDKPKVIYKESKQTQVSSEPLFIYRPDPNEPWAEYIPPTEEELQKKKEIKRLNTLYSLGVDLSILVVWALVWMLTSGWVTFFGFIAAIYVPFYLNEKHQAWKINNSKYLYQI